MKSLLPEGKPTSTPGMFKSHQRRRWALASGAKRFAFLHPQFPPRRGDKGSPVLGRPPLSSGKSQEAPRARPHHRGAQGLGRNSSWAGPAQHHIHCHVICFQEKRTLAVGVGLPSMGQPPGSGQRESTAPPLRGASSSEVVGFSLVAPEFTGFLEPKLMRKDQN